MENDAKAQAAEAVAQVRALQQEQMQEQQERIMLNMLRQQLLVVAFQMALDEEGVVNFKHGNAQDCINSVDVMMTAVEESN